MDITIDKLYEKLEKKLLNISCLTKFYIGETDNIKETIKRHENEGYTNTIILTKGSHPIITKAEEFLISKFNNSDLKDKIANKSPYSVGSKTAYMIYISLQIEPTKDEEMDDDDFVWSEDYVLK